MDDIKTPAPDVDVLSSLTEPTTHDFVVKNSGAQFIANWMMSPEPMRSEEEPGLMDVAGPPSCEELESRLYVFEDQTHEEALAAWRTANKQGRPYTPGIFPLLGQSEDEVKKLLELCDQKESGPSKIGKNGH